jgi:hypothetical protein
MKILDSFTSSSGITYSLAEENDCNFYITDSDGDMTPINCQETIDAFKYFETLKESTISE